MREDDSISRGIFEDLIHSDNIKYFLGLLEMHHVESYEHSLRVCYFAIKFSLLNYFDRDFAAFVGKCALLHDIGKVHIPLEILSKSSSLDPSQREEVKLHVRYGFEMLKGYVHPDVRKVIVAHHEHKRSYSYPRDRLNLSNSSDKIFFASKLISFIDIFDALYYPRSYKRSYSINEVERILSSDEFSWQSGFIDTLHDLIE